MRAALDATYSKSIYCSPVLSLSKEACREPGLSQERPEILRTVLLDRLEE